MERHSFVLAQSFLGGTFDWIVAGLVQTGAFVRDWIVNSVNARVFAIIAAVIVLFAIIARVRTGRSL
jgi:hypothetical protein